MFQQKNRFPVANKITASRAESEGQGGKGGKEVGETQPPSQASRQSGGSKHIFWSIVYGDMPLRQPVELIFGVLTRSYFIYLNEQYTHTYIYIYTYI